ncbi:MAG: hypothetical protein L3J67_07980, partial [Hyphomicrobiaceae bacterium]|nr:hypothetical protein [Hyphomicrobiaceae bacterium]
MALVADNNGELTGEFDIPENIPAGSKTVVFTGKGGTEGRAIYVGRGTIITRIFRRIFTTTTIRWQQRVDPLAQTFTLMQGCHISSVDVEFCKIGKRENPVIVQIRETDTGHPTQEVVAEATVSMAKVKTGRWTRCKFKSPVYLEDGVEYALVFMSDDADHSLAIAELGKFDKRHQKWMTEQPYQVGVLLSSSNASTWTAHQSRDLRFQINAAKFTAKERIVDFGSLKVKRCSDLLVEAGIEEPAVDTSVLVRVTRANGEQLLVHPGQTIRFDDWISETLKIA